MPALQAQISIVQQQLSGVHINPSVQQTNISVSSTMSPMEAVAVFLQQEQQHISYQSELQPQIDQPRIRDAERMLIRRQNETLQETENRREVDRQRQQDCHERALAARVLETEEKRFEQLLLEREELRLGRCEPVLNPTATQSVANIEELYLGPMNVMCCFCSAQMWSKERVVSPSVASPKFSICCSSGTIKLHPIHAVPEFLYMLQQQDQRSKQLIHHIWAYNSSFASTSIDAKQMLQLANMQEGVCTYQMNLNFNHFNRSRINSTRRRTTEVCSDLHL